MTDAEIKKRIQEQDRLLWIDRSRDEARAAVESLPYDVYIASLTSGSRETVNSNIELEARIRRATERGLISETIEGLLNGDDEVAMDALCEIPHHRLPEVANALGRAENLADRILRFREADPE